MNFKIDKTSLLEHIQKASKFTSSRIGGQTTLQGVRICIKKNEIHFYATDLNVFCHSSIATVVGGSCEAYIEPRKIVEFLQILAPGEIEVSLVGNSTLSVVQGKTRGTFPLLDVGDFPSLPNIKEQKHEIEPDFFRKKLPLLLFTASSDESRPVLSGISFEATEKGTTLVATDGFRLSVVKLDQKGRFAPMIIPAGFLQEVMRNASGGEKATFSYSKTEQAVCFTIGNTEFYSRLIEGEFPPYERVIPDEKKTTATVRREDLLRNTKIISIFARDASNIVIYTFSKKGLVLSPKKEVGTENTTTQDMEFKGEEMKVAFNFKYVIDFLNHTTADEIVVDLLRPDAPALFRAQGDDSFFHVIMPVRIQE